MAGLERRFTPITNEALHESFPNLARVRKAQGHIVKDEVPTGYEYIMTVDPNKLNTLVEQEEIRGVKRAGKIIKERRTDKELMQSELAEQCGFDRAVISYVENGKSRPHASNLLRITRSLELSLSQTLEVFSEANYKLPQIKPQAK